MRTVEVHVENHVEMAFERGSAAWTYDVDLWGRCGQGPDEARALDDLRAQLSGRLDLVVAEHLTGDERAFVRDHRPCTDEERQATLAILAECRRRTRDLVQASPDELLDWDDPDRALPRYATWRSLRELAWHVVDTESRYYLPMAGLGYHERAGDLRTELDRSAARVRAVVETMPPDLVRTTDDGTVWTSTKVLRRLAWHERGELAVMESLAARARRALALPS